MSDIGTLRKYKVLGTTDTAQGCECCGRTNLKVYVGLEPVEGGPVVFMGTTCAAKAERVAVKAIRDELTAIERAALVAAAAARYAADKAENVRFCEWVAATYGVTISQPSDLHGKVEGMTPFAIRKAFAVDA